MNKTLKSTLTVLGLCAATAGFNSAFADDNNGPAAAVPAGSLKANHGQVLCTAAISADGTVAAGQHVNKSAFQTRRLSIGTYEVDFKQPCGNVTAAKGFARWVQVDTLTTGTAAGSCTTADRAGDASSVWVQCINAVGGLADQSFFLFVAR